MVRYGAQRARLLRPRCIGAEGPRTQLLIYLYIYLSIYLSIYLFIHPSIDPSIHRSIHPSIHPSIYLPIYIPTYLPTYQTWTIRFLIPGRGKRFSCSRKSPDQLWARPSSPCIGHRGLSVYKAAGA